MTYTNLFFLHSKKDLLDKGTRFIQEVSQDLRWLAIGRLNWQFPSDMLGYEDDLGQSLKESHHLRRGPRVGRYGGWGMVWNGETVQKSHFLGAKYGCKEEMEDIHASCCSLPAMSNIFDSQMFSVSNFQHVFADPA